MSGALYWQTVAEVRPIALPRSSLMPSSLVKVRVTKATGAAVTLVGKQQRETAQGRIFSLTTEIAKVALLPKWHLCV